MSAEPDHPHRHDHDSPDTPAGSSTEGQALESLMVEKGLVDPAALDAIVEYYAANLRLPGGGDGPIFAGPWQARAFALTAQLSRTGISAGQSGQTNWP